FGAKVPGINTVFPAVSDSTIAVLIAVILFLIPVAESSHLLDWADAAKIPWGTLLIFGGGLSLADAFKRSQLDVWVGDSLKGAISGLPVFATIVVIIAITTIFSEFASNTATAALLMPLMFSMASELKIHPFMLMIPATVGASFGFALPVATPPNTIVFATGHVPVKDMIRAGIGMDIIAIVVGAIVFYLMRSFLLI
ncbi:MAG: SLC13 family permease, partial [bacterium]